MALAAISTGHAALDLNPRPHTFEIEGHKIEDVAFKYGSQLVTYSPPAGWRMSGSETQLQLIPPIAQAEAMIDCEAKSDEAFTPEVIEAFKKEILAKLPKGATTVEWSATRENPLQICGQPTVELEVSYSAFGKRFKSSMLVCNFTDEQLRFRVVAPESDFGRVHEPFRQSLYTLAGLR
ncbi:MAG: hypothetical protein ACO1QR_10255 [Chthoniobacteraceae bacterium]